MTPRSQLIDAAAARLVGRADAIAAAEEAIKASKTGAEKRASAVVKAELEAKSAAELEAETSKAIEAAIERMAAMSKAETVALHEKYVDPEAIFSALESGATVAVRASWLRDQPAGALLPKRGELPPEAVRARASSLGPS